MRIIGNDPSVPRQTQEIASGTVSSGKPVIVNSDGTVSLPVSVTGGNGTPNTFSGGDNATHNGMSEVGNSKFVIAYRDGGNSNYGTAVVATGSGTTLSYGTKVAFDNQDCREHVVVYDSSTDRVAIFYYGTGDDKSYAIVGTVSGTSISFGTRVEFEPNEMGDGSGVFDPVNNKVVFFYKDVGSNTNYGRYIIGTISGTSISLTTPTVFHSAITRQIAAVYDTTNSKMVVAYRDVGASSHGKMIVADPGASSLTLGSEQTFASATSYPHELVDDTVNGNLIIFYAQASQQGAARVITVDGANKTISAGSELIYESGSTDTTGSAAFNTSAGKAQSMCKDQGDSNKAKLYLFSVSGTTITLDSTTVIDTNGCDRFAGDFSPSLGASVFVYTDEGASQGEAFVTKLGYNTLTSENYIGMSSGPVSPSVLGTELTYVSENASENILAFDSNNNKVVFAYTDGSNSPQKGVAVVANVSGTTMTAGSAVTFANVDTSMGGMAFDSSNNKIVIAYRDGSDTYGKAVVGTVSGTSISFGSPVTFKSGNTNNIDCCFDSNANKIYISFGYNNTGIGIVGTVSGTSISFGSEQIWIGSEATYIKNTFDSSNNKVVTVYRDAGGAGYGKAIVGTISGTSVSYGSPTAFNSGNTSYTNAEFDSVNNKVVIFFQQSTYKAIVATVSGTSISFGSEVEWSSVENFGNFGASFDPTLGKMIVIYKTTGNITASKQGTVSGTSISFSDQQSNITSGQVYTPRITYDTNSKVSVLVYRLTTNSNYGTTRVYNPEIRGQVADGGHALIDTQGAISDNQGSLTAGQSYFVQNDGTIGTTAADPSVFAGTAVSATKLIVKG
jgi:hypothetical protein